MIDPVTGWFEVAALGEEAPDSDIVQQTFDSVWLARYPRPQEIGVDNGKPFMRLFKQLCKNMGIQLNTAHNPQGNSVVERIHQVLGNALRTAHMQDKDLDKRYPFDEFLSSAAYAIRCTYHTTLKATPGQLVFGRDMYFPTKFVADWARIAMRKQGEIDRSNERENVKRIAHDYHVGDLVLIHKPGILPKMEAPREGPFVVAVVHSNGTLTIQKGPVTERVNIRRVQPYFTSEP
jgi:transposase InsO family protein